MIVTLQNPDTVLCIHECHLLASSPLNNLYKATLFSVQLSRPKAHRYNWLMLPLLQGKKSVPPLISQPLHSQKLREINKVDSFCDLLQGLSK